NGGTATWLVSANSGKTTEVTTITVPVIPKSATATIGITLTADSTQQLATLVSCSYKKSSGKAVIASITWSKGWE
ncbi:MAG: hypothetical protein M3Q51_09225, partial [Pseudomonadota bacterium]|nr:hypothetical protein [Pseudomonadota bacterium]